MGKKVKWNWTSFLIGATTATTTTFLFFSKPKPPKFHLISLTSLQIKFINNNNINNSVDQTQVNFPRFDADLILTVHVTNPNILPIQYTPTSLSIYYDGSLLGRAHVPAGSQPGNSCQLLRLQARLNGQVWAQHVKKFIRDVTRREMVIGADVDICGWVKVRGGLWGPRFKVHVDSRIVVDPVLLDVIDQDNESSLKLFVK